MQPSLGMLGEFIKSERENYLGEDNNRFAFALGQVGRYERFLWIIVGRYRESSTGFRDIQTEMTRLFTGEPGRSYVVSPEGIVLLKRQGHVADRLHLEIETFYLFSKILLDHAARFLETYFGPVRGLSLDSHDVLTKNFEAFGARHGLCATANVAAMLPILKQRIADYRDYQIAHAKSPRTMHMTIWGGDKEPRLATTRLYPTAKEAEQMKKESENVEALMRVLEQYLTLLTDLIVANRSRSKFNGA